MNNIDIFKAISALAFAKIYDQFPLKTKLSPNALAISLDDEFWNESEKQISNNLYEHQRNRSPAAIAKPTIEWLASAGLITYESYKDGCFRGVIFTAKGLESIESGEKRGSKLLEAAKEIIQDEFKDQARIKLKDLFSEVLAWSIEKSPTIVQAITNVPS